MLSDIRARFPADATLAALDADLKRQLYGPELALQELNKQQSPDTPATLLTGALLALDIGDNDAALEKAHQLITLAPDNADYLNLYAGILLQAQQYQSANQTLQQLLKLKPEHFAGRLTLANLYISQDKIQEAETSCKKKLESIVWGSVSKIFRVSRKSGQTLKSITNKAI